MTTDTTLRRQTDVPDIIVPDPGSVPDKEIALVLERVSKLIAEEKAAGRELRSLLDRRPVASDSDNSALAEWVKNGRTGTQPGPEASNALEREIGEARRLREATATAAVEAINDLRVGLRERGPDAAAKIEARAAKARLATRVALAAADRARTELAEVRALQSWLSGDWLGPNGAVRNYRSRIAPVLLRGAEFNWLDVTTILATAAAEIEPAVEVDA